jgi:hypothetical protein
MAPNLNANPVRTVPYPTVFRYNLIYHTRSLWARGVAYFQPKIHLFSAEKFKSANHTVFKIKRVLTLRLNYVKSAVTRLEIAAILKQIIKKVLARTVLLKIFLRLNPAISAKRTALLSVFSAFSYKNSSR